MTLHHSNLPPFLPPSALAPAGQRGRGPQTPATEVPDRKEHVWTELVDGRHQCCLCGAVVKGAPPPYPTPDRWMPDGYEPLTDALRRLCPRVD